jgi:hypothetical protein
MLLSVRTLVCLGMTFAWIGWTASVAWSQSCQDLAQQYQTAPAQMDANALAALQSCQTSESQEQPDTSQPDPAQQPQSSGNSPYGQSGWGQWPSSAPWSDQKGKSQSWGDHISE